MGSLQTGVLGGVACAREEKRGQIGSSKEGLKGFVWQLNLNQLYNVKVNIVLLLVSAAFCEI